MGTSPGPADSPPPGRVLQIEFPEDLPFDAVADLARAAKLDDRGTLGREQLESKPLRRPNQLLGLAVSTPSLRAAYCAIRRSNVSRSRWTTAASTHGSSCSSSRRASPASIARTHAWASSCGSRESVGRSTALTSAGNVSPWITSVATITGEREENEITLAHKDCSFTWPRPPPRVTAPHIQTRESTRGRVRAAAPGTGSSAGPPLKICSYNAGGTC